MGYNNNLWLIINKNKMRVYEKDSFLCSSCRCLVLAVPANAQFKFGPKVGMNISLFLSVEICLIISRQIIFRALREV